MAPVKKGGTTNNRPGRKGRKPLQQKDTLKSTLRRRREKETTLKIMLRRALKGRRARAYNKSKHISKKFSTQDHQEQYSINPSSSLPNLRQEQQSKFLKNLNNSVERLPDLMHDQFSPPTKSFATVPAVATTKLQRIQVAEIFPNTTETNVNQQPTQSQSQSQSEVPIKPLDRKARILLAQLKEKISSNVTNIISTTTPGSPNELLRLKKETKHYDESLELVSDLCSELTKPLGELIKTLHINMKQANSEMHFAYTREQDYWNTKKKKYKNKLKAHALLINNYEKELKLLHKNKIAQMNNTIAVEMKLSKALYDLGNLEQSLLYSNNVLKFVRTQQRQQNGSSSFPIEGLEKLKHRAKRMVHRVTRQINQEEKSSF